MGSRCPASTHAVSIALSFLTLLALLGPSALPAAESRIDPGARPELTLVDASAPPGILGERPEAIPGLGKRAEAWRSFARSDGGPWDVWLDRRSGVPLLAQGAGLDWAPGLSSADPRAHEKNARAFLLKHQHIFGLDPSELRLSDEGSGPMDADHAILLFERAVGGVPVEDDQVRLYLVRGRLVAFGATGWGKAPGSLTPAVSAEEATSQAIAHMKPVPGDPVPTVDTADLVLVPAAEGESVVLRLAWRVVLLIDGDPATWVARVDAATGDLFAFEDETKYDTLRGGVYPITNDGVCPEGCQQSYPMPFADVEARGEATGAGWFFCGAGRTVSTELQGPHTRRIDTCGELFETDVCGEGFDLGSSGGTNCSVDPGSSPGNTAASRTVYYHLNRAQEKARSWLPFLSFPLHPLLAFVNFPGTCNAFYNGAVGYFAAGGGCANAGEIGSIVVHEFAHGLDEQDGGGYDIPTEGYADVAALLQDRRSCFGEGFRPGQLCTGFGDACLECTGIRELDWERREAMTPATPAGFIAPRCPIGNGACGRQQHCESHVVAETIFDLATRDLPAMGIDPDTSWQITERLWYVSRVGSGGKIFNCALPLSDGCGAGNWFTRMRVTDDDDANLANGTPHAGAIFAAFARHGIACGAAGDLSNRSTPGCPTLAAPELAAVADPDQIDLSWSPATGATGYRVLRTEVSCEYSQNVIAQAFPGEPEYTDRFPPRDLALHYRVQPLSARTACDGPVSSCVTVASHGWEGAVSFDRSLYTCDSTIAVTVYDGNIGSEPAVLSSTSEPSGEILTLAEEIPFTARYVGRIMATGAPSPAGDGMLRAADGDTLTARYIDSDDGRGGHGIVREATARVDCTPPSISSLAVQILSQSSALVTWRTPEPATTLVRWGEIDPGEEDSTDASLVTDHAVVLTGLRRCTRYFLESESRDAAGNAATGGGSGGGPLVFETPGDFGQGLQQCHRAVVQLDKPAAGCNGSLPVRLTDMDLNLHPDLADAAQLRVTSTTETIPEIAFLRETGANTSTFTGSILTGPGPAAPGDRRLQTAHADLLTASYTDADDGAGTARTAFATGTADCRHAGIVNIQVTPTSDAEAIVSWTTAEPATGLLEWGTTPDLGVSVQRNVFATSQSAEIEPIEECGRIYFQIRSTDTYGNKAVADAGQGPLEFSGVTIPGAIFADDFEKATGWSLEGEWQIGPPTGTGVAPDDPEAALFGAHVLGQDLSGLGGAPRLYELLTDESATSPGIDATLLRNGELRLYRYLNTGPSAPASIEILTPAGWVRLLSFDNRSTTFWTREVLSIAPWADGNPDLRIRLRQQTPATLDRRGGWNVDRLVVRDGSLPAFTPCGGCAGAPSMEGITSAVDLDPCAASGISLTWKRAVSWGTGKTGSYAVYRGTSIGFIPSPASLQAFGLTGTSWVDPAPPPDADLYYLVRAENDESCAAGPGNGGLTDVNVRYVLARDETSQPAPGEVPGDLEARNDGNAHVQLLWGAAPQAAAYHVYRAAAPRGPFDLIGETGGTFFEDAGAGGATQHGYYVVRAADACGNEGP